MWALPARVGAQASRLGTNLGGRTEDHRHQRPHSQAGGMPGFQFAMFWSNLGNANTGSPFFFREQNQYVPAPPGMEQGPTRCASDGLLQSADQPFQPQGGSFQERFAAPSTSTAQHGPADTAPPCLRFNKWGVSCWGLASRAGQVERSRFPTRCASKPTHVCAGQWQVNHKRPSTMACAGEYYPFTTRGLGSGFPALTRRRPGVLGATAAPHSLRERRRA